ncbi:uncharacterized protein LOC108029248 [Drosophila biarmipes]|uniref:uncharacterized protein LOC108029248 n=1 Tax=Drosophila biarmipes TaxID=125945 RepID=UPI0007E6A94E|nr:uncharacterized protein LOC108029248 [Drosophila biarmipes]
MKFLSELLLICILISLVFGQKDPICSSEPVVSGNCTQAIKGYTYATGRHRRCKQLRLAACTITGNYFRRRNECVAKCQSRILVESEFFNFWNQAMAQLLSAFTILIDFARPWLRWNN